MFRVVSVFNRLTFGSNRKEEVIMLLVPGSPVVALHIVGKGPLLLPPKMRKLIKALRRQRSQKLLTVEYYGKSPAGLDVVIQVELLTVNSASLDRWKKIREISPGMSLVTYCELENSPQVPGSKLVPISRTPLSVEGYQLAAYGVPFPRFARAASRTKRGIHLLEVKLDYFFSPLGKNHQEQSLVLYVCLDSSDDIGERAWFWWLEFSSEETDCPLLDFSHLAPHGPLWAGIVDLTGQLSSKDVESNPSVVYGQVRDFIARFSKSHPEEIGLNQVSQFSLCEI